MKIAHKEQVNIIEAYEIQFKPIITLAKQYGVTRQAIYKILWQAGIDTTKKRLPVSCDVCGTEHLRPRCQIRNRKHMFCSPECYHAYLEAGNGNPYIASSHGGRMARKIVAEHFPLELTHIVHHEDRNQFNNEPINLKVFRNQGDHVRYHRGFDIQPLWDGSNL